MTRWLSSGIGVLLLVAVVAPWGLAQEPAAPPTDGAQLESMVLELVEQLGSTTVAERDLAEENLLKLAGLAGGERVLAVLPKVTDDMPPAVSERMVAIRRQIEDLSARSATAGSTVTLTATAWKLSEVLKELEKQTGNRVVDLREQQGEVVTDPEITLVAEKEPYLSVLDQVLDQAGLAVAEYSTEGGAVGVVTQTEGASPRYFRAAYQGPFRIEVVELTGTRGVRQPDQQSLRLGLEFAWEPRLKPIAISQPVAMLDAQLDLGQALTPQQPEQVFDIEVTPDATQTQIEVPFGLPPRDARQIATLSGKFMALLPGKQEEFRFDKLVDTKPRMETRGGVQVSLDRVRKNNAVWEVHMRLRLADAQGALASHRGWVFNNATFLVGADGKPIDHAGFETTMQSEDEVGIAYLFELPEGTELKDLTWVYRTPAAIVMQEFTFDLLDLELP